jgi:DNA repair exonuclease SbcCD ATPase subunit
MKGNITDYMEMAQSARYGIEKESDRLIERLTQMEDYRKLLDVIDEVIADNKRQQEEIESLQQQLEEKKNAYEVLAGTTKNLLDAATEARNQKKELEMQLAETRKLSEGVAKKSSEEGVIKALQIFVNRSKTKKADKRAYIKTTILEFANTIKLSLPDELANSIDNLDDEQSEPKTVTVNGNYNDIHDNGEVKVKS